MTDAFDQPDPDHPEQDPSAGTRMTLADHLDELRTRLLKSLYGLAIVFVICLYFAGDLLGLLAQPLLLALHMFGYPPALYATSLAESFVTYIRVALYAAVFASSPWTFHQLWSFIAPGLNPHERRHVRFIVPFSAVLFILGAVFFIGVVAPVSCAFFVRFSNAITKPQLRDTFITRILTRAYDPPAQQPTAPGQPRTEPLGSTAPPADLSSPDEPMIKPLFSLQRYVSLILLLALAFSLAFQTPLLVFFLGRLRLVKLQTFCAVRRYVFFGIVVLAAVMTPPDVVSQLALGLPMYALYELGILMLRIAPARQMM